MAFITHPLDFIRSSLGVEDGHCCGCNKRLKKNKKYFCDCNCYYELLQQEIEHKA